MYLRSTGSALIVTVIVAATPFSAYADKCTISKLKAVAKKEYGLLGCSAKAVKVGDPSVLDACVAKVTSKFTTSFAKAGTCAGEESDCTVIVDESCIPAVQQLLPDGGPSKCEAARLKAAGKRASAAILCYTKNPATLAACQTKANAKFLSAFGKVIGCGGDGQADAVASSVDASCVNAVVTADVDGTVTALCVTTTTTSTTTTSSTITTTTTTSTSTTTIPCAPQPAGSYRDSCTGCSTCSGRLVCTCAFGGQNPFTCQFNPGQCSHTSLSLGCNDVSNCNGTLTCGPC